MTEDARTFTPRGPGIKSRTYTVDYFIGLMRKLDAESPEGNMNYAARNYIAEALAKNPNLNVEHLEKVTATVPESIGRDILKAILSREDKHKFIGQVFSAIDATKDPYTVYVLGTAILFDGGLKDHHVRAMDALASLKEWRDYNVQLHDFLPGPCLSYKFFIRDMLSQAGSVEEAEKWLAEYGRLEEAFLAGETALYTQDFKDPAKREKDRIRSRNRMRDEMYRSLAGNHHLPWDYLRRLFGYADAIEDELLKASFWGKLLSCPNISREECLELFEAKKRQLRNKNLVNSLLYGLAINPIHYQLYIDYVAKRAKKNPKRPRFSFPGALIENPRLDSLELDRVVDRLSGTKYGPRTEYLKSLLSALGWSLVLLLRRQDLSETHHERVRKEAVRFLEMIDGDEFYGLHTNIGRDSIYVDYLNEFNLLLILSIVRLNDEFIRYIFDYAARKDNGGLLVAGLLPNPGLAEEWYDRAVGVLEQQYVGRDERLLISQRSTFNAENVYRLWPASPYVK